MISQVQQNSGIFISVMPGARMFRIVTMMLIEPMIELRAQDVHREDAGVHRRAHLQRQRRVERPAGRGRAAGHEERARPASAPAGISSQKLRLFMRANAMSAAPICSGIIQFAKPTNAGMIAPNTMISAVHRGQLVEQLAG